MYRKYCIENAFVVGYLVRVGGGGVVGVGAVGDRVLMVECVELYKEINHVVQTAYIKKKARSLAKHV